MDTSKLKPNDPRVKSCYDIIRGKRYHYILGEPPGTKRDTMLLVHGFPDMSFGWRYQVPYFMSLGFRVIVPDCVGYARTEAPADLAAYTFKEVAADMKELVTKFVGADGQIVLGGHDWGGTVAWRIADWYPELVKLVFVVCTPYIPPTSKKYRSLEDLVRSGVLSSLAYHQQLAGPDVEARIQGRDRIREFLNAMYGGKGADRSVGFTVEDGILPDKLGGLRRTKFLGAEELDFYADEYMRQPAPQLRGPLNWYRTRRLNHDADVDLARAGTGRLSMPALFIAASKDEALPPSMSRSMERHFDDLTRREVAATHWVLWQKPDEVNRIVGEWLEKKLPVRALL